MTTRHRTQNGLPIAGVCEKFTTVLPRSVNSYDGFCDDTVTAKPYSDHPLDIQFRKGATPLINGQSGVQGTASWRYAKRCPTSYSGIFVAHQSLPVLPSLAQLATTVLARSNPSTAQLQLPVSLIELRELPLLLKNLGDLLKAGKHLYLRRPLPSPGKFGASQYLSWEFGWKPLLSDVRKTLDFVSSTEKRFNELKNLRDNGGLRRTVQLNKDAVDSSSTVIYESFLAIVNARESRGTTRKVWGHVKWVPNTENLPQSEEELRKLARSLVWSCNSSQIASNIWNAIPWTWLIDWFSNVGDFLEATNNSVAYQSGPVNIMTTTHTSITIHPLSIPSGFTVEPGVGYTTNKKRQLVTSPTLDASLPALTGRQLSILGSLAVLKQGRLQL